MRVTGSTDRPRVSEIMQMPLVSLRQAPAGVRVALGDRLPEIEARRAADPSAPTIGKTFQLIKEHLIALMNASSL